jgi:hypothetical protein
MENGKSRRTFIQHLKDRQSSGRISNQSLNIKDEELLGPGLH